MRGYGDEFTRSQIIGGPSFVGRLYYDGRPQGGDMFGNDDAELMQKAREAKAKWLKECAFVYPDDSKWVLRIHP